MKKILSLLLCITIIAAVASGCGNADATDPASSEGSSTADISPADISPAETDSVPETESRFAFQPKVSSPFLEEVFGKDMCDGCKSLESLVIGSKVEAIGSLAFYSCSKLTSVTCKATTVPLLAGQACFNNETYKNATLQVPRSAEQDYRQAAFWKNFKTIVGIDIHLPGDVNADGSINIADVNALIAAILNGDRSTVLDVNGDGTINITDINTVINYIIK